MLKNPNLLLMFNKKKILFFSIPFLIFFIVYINNTILKKETTTFNEKLIPISNSSSNCTTVDDDETCISILNEKSKYNLVWFGNSQLMMINEKKENEKTAPELLRNDFDVKKLNVVGFSHPNMSLKEYYILLNYLLSKKIKIDYLILGLCFDDLRESKVRDKFIEKYLSDDNTHNLIKKNKSEFNKNLQNNDIKIFNKSKIEDNFLFFKSEEKITSLLKEKFNYSDFSDNVQRNLEIIFYRIRNFIFNINPQSIRKVLPAAYRENINFLEEIIKLSKEKNITLINYIVPIRDDYKIPYEEKAYLKFKKSAELLTNKSGNYFFNLENSVSNKNYGSKKSTSVKKYNELDFMHFNYNGQIQLKDKIFEILNLIINDI
jgi:hypothetical protein